MAEQTLQEKVDKLQQPTTALGAQMVGGTPKQQDMAGTKAAKTRVAKEATLIGADRLETPVVALGASDGVKKSQELATLGGSAAQRVANLVNRSVNAPAQTSARIQVQGTQLGSALGLTPAQLAAQKADPNSNYSKATTALLSYAEHPGSERTRAAALTALTALGIQPAQAAELIDTSAAGLAGTISKAPMTMAQVDLKGLAPNVNNVADLAKALGMPLTELSAMSVSDLPAAIESVRQREAASDSLRAQIAALPAGSAQAQILQQQLQAVTAAGSETAKQAVKTSIQDIDLADEIEIGGEKFNAEQLLGDGELSGLVERWLTATDPAERERLVPAGKFPGLSQWLTSHEQALGTLTSQLQAGVEQFTGAKDAQANLGGGALSPTLAAALGIAAPAAGATAVTVAAQQAKLDSTGIGQLIKAGNTALVTKLSTLPPEVQKQIAGMSAADITSADKAAQDIAADPDLARLAGVSSANGLVLNPADRAKIEAMKPAVDAIKQAGHSTWLEDPAFAKLPPADMVILNSNPERYTAFAAYNTNKDQLSKIASYKPADPAAWAPMMQSIFGAPIDIAAMDANYANAVKYAALGDPAAAKVKAQLEMLGYGATTPKFSKTQATRLQSLVKGRLDKVTTPDIISGKIVSVPGVDPSASNQSLVQAMTVPVRPTASTSVANYDQYLDDSRIDSKEIEQELRLHNGDSPELLAFIKSQPNNTTAVSAYNAAVANYAQKAIDTELDNVLDMDPSSNALTAKFLDPKLPVAQHRELLDKARPSIEAAIKMLEKQSRSFPARRGYAATRIAELRKLITDAEALINKKSTATRAPVKRVETSSTMAVDEKKTAGQTIKSNLR